MHNILLLLGSSNVVSREWSVVVDDPNKVQLFAFRRTLSIDDKESELSKFSVNLPQQNRRNQRAL
jgi:hypothetical protein